MYYCIATWQYSVSGTQSVGEQATLATSTAVGVTEAAVTGGKSLTPEIPTGQVDAVIVQLHVYNTNR